MTPEARLVAKRWGSLTAAMFASANLALLIVGVGTPLNVLGLLVAIAIWIAMDMWR